MQLAVLLSIESSDDRQSAQTKEKRYGATILFSGLARLEKHRKAIYESPLGAGLLPLSRLLRDVRSSWPSSGRKARSIRWARICPSDAADQLPG
jgi:hypothetical protein